MISQQHKLIPAFVLALILSIGTGAVPGMSAEPISSTKAAKTDSTAPAEEVTRLVINVPSRTLWVYSGDKIIRYFPVGVGRVGYPTPLGKFKVIRKVIDPGWENPYLSKGEMRIAPGDENPLGTRWIGFLKDPGGEYGMHGTDNPGSVGKFSSHGCVRLKVSDAEALFEMVEVGTPVEVVYEPVIIRQHGEAIRVAVYSDRFHKGMPSIDELKARILEKYPQASVDESKLKTALSQPRETYISVGNIEPSPSVGAQALNKRQESARSAGEPSRLGTLTKSP